PHVVMLSYGTWQRRFGGRASIVGQAVRMSGELYTIAGVLPADFQFARGGAVEFWTTLDQKGGCAVRRSCHDLDAVALLKDGVSLQAAQANMTAIARQLEKLYPESNRGQGVDVMPLADAFTGPLRPVLLALLGGAVLLWLIACVNVASLLLVRAESRRREIAVRSALGASRGRLLNQFVTEGMMVVVAASAAALLSATAAMSGLESLIPEAMTAYMPFLADMGLSLRTIAAAGVLALIALALFSATPTLHLVFSKLREGLTEGSRGSAGRGWQRLGSRLVVVELSIAMVLLVTAGLFGKSLYRLLHVELNFHPDHLAMVNAAAPDAIYSKPEQVVAVDREIARSVASLPGVVSVGLTTSPPAAFNGNTTWIRFPGRPYDGKHIEVNERDVNTDYFRTIAAKMVRGRGFTEFDDASRPQVVIINRTLAARYFPGQDPIGQQIGDSNLTPKYLKTIVGVVDDIREGALDQDIWPAVYHPLNQDSSTYVIVLARTSERPEALLPELRTAIHRVHPDVGVDGESTMDDFISNSLTA